MKYKSPQSVEQIGVSPKREGTSARPLQAHEEQLGF